MKKVFPLSLIFFIFAGLILVGGFLAGGMIADATPVLNGVELQSSFNWRLALMIWGGTILVLLFYLPLPILLWRQERIIKTLNEFE